MKDIKTTEEKTNFQGAVSLEAIFAATQGKSTTPIIKEEKKPKEGEKPIESNIIDKKPVETTPTIKEEEIIVPPVNTEETDAFKTAKQLISLGVLEDFTIQISDEDENGTLISEFTGMTEENLEEIVKIYNQDKKEDIKSNYIPKKGLKEHQLKVIEILKNGGDLSQIAESEDEAFKRPFEDFDMDDKQRQVDVYYTDLVHGKGLDHDSAIVLIDKEVKNGKIKETSQAIFDSYRTAHSKYIDKILEEKRKDKEYKDLNFKENKKTLVAKLKEAGLKESVYKKVASEYSKKNKNGEYTLVDKLKEALSKPEDNHELILHLADKSIFNETFKIKASNETQRTIVRLASKSASKGNRQVVKTQHQQENTAPWLKAAEIHNNNLKK